MQKLSAISDNAIAFFSCLQEHRLLLALLAGLTLSFLLFMKKDEHQKAPVGQRCLIFFHCFVCYLAYCRPSVCSSSIIFMVAVWRLIQTPYYGQAGFFLPRSEQPVVIFCDAGWHLNWTDSNTG